MKNLLLIGLTLFLLTPEFAEAQLVQTNGFGPHASLDSAHAIRYSIALAVGPELVFGTPGFEGSLSYFRYKGNFIYGARALVSGGWPIIAALAPEAGLSVGKGVRASISAGLGLLMLHEPARVSNVIAPNFGPSYDPAIIITTFYLDMPLDFSLLVLAGKDLGLVFTSHLDLNVSHPLFGLGAGLVYYR